MSTEHLFIYYVLSLPLQLKNKNSSKLIFLADNMKGLHLFVQNSIILSVIIKFDDLNTFVIDFKGIEVFYNSIVLTSALKLTIIFLIKSKSNKFLINICITVFNNLKFENLSNWLYVSGIDAI